MAAFYLIRLSVGVVIVSLRRSCVDLMHVLFGMDLACAIFAESILDTQLLERIITKTDFALSDTLYPDAMSQP